MQRADVAAGFLARMSQRRGRRNGAAFAALRPRPRTVPTVGTAARPIGVPIWPAPRMPLQLQNLFSRHGATRSGRRCGEFFGDVGVPQSGQVHDVVDGLTLPLQGFRCRRLSAKHIVDHFLHGVPDDALQAAPHDDFISPHASRYHSVRSSVNWIRLVIAIGHAAVALCVVLSVASPTFALTISGAKIDKGAVQVKGKKATPFATITWEGNAVAQATKSGAFKFATSVLPSDCVGTVSDGTASAGAVIASCGPQGRPGLALVVKDAQGAVVGPYSPSDSAVVVAGPDGPTQIGLDGTGQFYRAGFLYESTDCTGPRLLGLASALILEASVLDGTAYYEPATGVSTTWRSSDIADAVTAEQCATHPPATFTPPDRCCCGFGVCVTIEQPAVLGQPRTLDVSQFVPPFHVEVQ